MKKPTFRASAVGKCAATLYQLALHGPEDEDPTENPMQLFLLMGHSAQSALVKYLSYFDITPVSEEREVTKSYSFFNLIGHMDAELELKGETITGEIKALKDKNYRLVSRGKHWAKVRPEYYTQFQMYLELSGNEQGSMFFINRDDHKKNLLHGFEPLDAPCGTFHESLFCGRDDSFIAAQLHRLELIAKAVAKGEPMACDKTSGRCWDCFPNTQRGGRKGSRKPLSGKDRDDAFERARKAMENVES